MQKIVLANGQTQMVNTDFTNPNAAVQNMIIQNQLTESLYMGRLELDNHHHFGKNITRAGVYAENIKTNWELSLQACSFTPSAEMTAKFNEYYQPVVDACMHCNEMVINHDVNSSQLIKNLTLQSKVVTISNFILGLKNDYNKAASNMRVLNEDQVNTALYLTRNGTLDKISQGRFNELTAGDMEYLQKSVCMVEQRAENTILMLFFSEMISYLMIHYAEVMQTLQNLAHMPTENGQGLLVALEKMLWMDNNKALIYKAQMSEMMMDYNQQNPQEEDINVIGARALIYMQQGMNTENAYLRARQEINNEKQIAINTEMSKYHDKILKNHKITNPELMGIPTEYNTQAVGIQPISPGMGPVKLGLNAGSAPGMMPGVQSQYNYAPPVTQMGTQMGTGSMMPYQQPAANPAPAINIPGAKIIKTDYRAQPLFPNGAPNANAMQQGQQIYNNGAGNYVPVTNYNPTPVDNSVVNINGVLCKETSPGSGTYIAINQAPKISNPFDAMYPNGVM